MRVSLSQSFKKMQNNFYIFRTSPHQAVRRQTIIIVITNYCDNDDDADDDCRQNYYIVLIEICIDKVDTKILYEE